MGSTVQKRIQGLGLGRLGSGKEKKKLSFEVFDKRRANASKRPFVTIQRGGPFSLNRAAYEAMGSPEVVELLFDPKDQLIAFKPANPSSSRAYPVRAQGKNEATLTVAGQAFTKNYGIDTSVARRYGVEMRDGLLVLDLSSESADVTGPRAKKRASG